MTAATSYSRRGNSRSRTMLSTGGSLLLLAAAIVIPLMASPYDNSQLTLVCVWAIAALGLNLITGYLGLISVGHGAIVAIGAYVSTYAAAQWGFPLWLGVLAGAAGGGLIGLVIGLSSIRLRGLYLALTTLALAVGVPPLMARIGPGGPNGTVVAMPSAPDWSGLADDQWVYYCALVGLVLLMLFTRRITTGTFGLLLVSTKQSPISAASMGVPTTRVRLAYFAISSAYAGVAGALFAATSGFVSPESFPLLLSVWLLAAVVVGGLSTIYGAVVGAFYITYVPLLASDWGASAAGLVYGASIVVVMAIAPAGIVGVAYRLLTRRRSKQAPREEASVPRPAANPTGSRA
jgi:branched-chain amino acid transport system permease protein